MWDSASEVPSAGHGRILRVMGFIKDAKSNAIATEAERAVAEGRIVFAAMLNTPMSQHTMSGSIAGWG